MSKQIYWGVVSNRKSLFGFGRIWPQRLHFRAHDAKQEARRWNEMEKKFRNPKKYIVVRYILEHKKETYYDMYKHEVKKI